MRTSKRTQTGDPMRRPEEMMDGALVVAVITLASLPTSAPVRRPSISKISMPALTGTGPRPGSRRLAETRPRDP